MSKINHRRQNKPAVDRRLPSARYTNGYARQDGTEAYRGGEPIERQESQPRVGSTGYLDKSMHGWKGQDKFSDVSIIASIGNDFANGHRGMARAVAGAKKFVRSRLRFHSKAATRRAADEGAKD